MNKSMTRAKGDAEALPKPKKPSLLPPKNGDTLWDQLTIFYLIPEGAFLREWNRFMVVVAIVNAILSSFMAAFQYHTAATWVFTYLIDAIFLLDIYIKFHVAYLVGGFWVVFPREMAVHYLRSPDFIFDVLANFPVDFVALGWVGQGMVQTKLSIIRLWKVMRTGRVFLYYKREERKLHAGFGIQVAKFVSYAIVLSHLLACVWFSNACSGTINWPMADITPACAPDSWVVMTTPTNYATASLQELYISSLYWTVVTMTTLGYGDIRPACLSERVFAMFTVLSGVIFYGYINGTIASTLSNMDSRRVGYQQRLDAVKQYMSDRDMDPDMKERVLNYYDYVWERNKGIDVRGLFGDMPMTFKQEVALSLVNQIIDNAIIFKECSIGFRRMISIDMKLFLFTANEYVVHRNDLGLEMYFITQGRIDIYATDDLRRPTASLIEGAYFGEFCVVLGNRHEYSARAVCNTDIYVFSKEDLEHAFEAYPADRVVVNAATSKRHEAHLQAKRSRQAPGQKGKGGGGNILNELDDLEEEFGVRGSVMKGDHPVHLGGGKVASIRQLEAIDDTVINNKSHTTTDAEDIENALPATKDDLARRDSAAKAQRRLSNAGNVGSGYAILDRTMAAALSQTNLANSRAANSHKSSSALTRNLNPNIKSTQSLHHNEISTVPPPIRQSTVESAKNGSAPNSNPVLNVSTSRQSVNGGHALAPPRVMLEQPSGEFDVSQLVPDTPRDV